MTGVVRAQNALVVRGRENQATAKLRGCEGEAITSKPPEPHVVSAFRRAASAGADDAPSAQARPLLEPRRHELGSNAPPLTRASGLRSILKTPAGATESTPRCATVLTLAQIKALATSAAKAGRLRSLPVGLEAAIHKVGDCPADPSRPYAAALLDALNCLNLSHKRGGGLATPCDSPAQRR